MIELRTNLQTGYERLRLQQPPQPTDPPYGTVEAVTKAASLVTTGAELWHCGVLDVTSTISRGAANNRSAECTREAVLAASSAAK